MKKSKLVRMELIKASSKVQEIQEAAQLELIKASDKVQELQETARQAEAEETAILESVHEKIKAICAEHNLFCGMIFGPKDIAAIVELMIERKEPVKVNFVLYPIDND